MESMKPYVYHGIEPSTYFWVSLALAIILFVFIIIEEKKPKGWKKLSLLTVGAPLILMIVSFSLFIHADGVAKSGLEASNAEIAKTLTATGLVVLDSNVINVSPNTTTTVKVSYPDAKDDTTCGIFAPKDANQDVAILCGTTVNGMTPENLVKWFKAGEPKDTSKFEVTTEESQRIAGLVVQKADSKDSV